MNDILLATIPALIVLIAMLSVRFVEHYLQSKRETERRKLEREREIRDARRRYRESIANPVREVLDKLGVSLAWRDFINLMSITKAQGILLKPETIKDIEMLEEFQHRKDARNLRETYTEFMPLIASITNEETRKAIQQAFACIVFSKETRELLKITEEDAKQKFRLAYQKLEDFTTLSE